MTLPTDIASLYQIIDHQNALETLARNPDEMNDVFELLRDFRFTEEDLLAKGGSRSLLSKRLDGFLRVRNWEERKYRTSSGYETHKIDCWRGRVALEGEWNNKNPFFDRDLADFRILHRHGVIDLGIIITRCTSLQATFKRLGIGQKYGASTTHLGKLLPLLKEDSSGDCPILVVGITDRVMEAA